MNLESGLVSFLPPSLLLLYPSQYGDIISLTVSTQVHLVIHIIKETKTTDVFLNLEVCIKTCLLLCMFLCCREMEKMSSHTTVFEQISSKLVMEILFGATGFRTTVGDNR